jgi:hypothetical protein
MPRKVVLETEAGREDVLDVVEMDVFTTDSNNELEVCRVGDVSAAARWLIDASTIDVVRGEAAGLVVDSV